VALASYKNKPLHQLAQEFIQAWQEFRVQFSKSLQMPNLSDETENQFFKIKTEIVKRSRIVQEVSGGKWGVHEKVKGLLNTCQSLDYLRQETQILHDSIDNQWHDVFIQATKQVAIFKDEFEKSQN